MTDASRLLVCAPSLLLLFYAGAAARLPEPSRPVWCGAPSCDAMYMCMCMCMYMYMYMYVYSVIIYIYIYIYIHVQATQCYDKSCVVVCCQQLWCCDVVSGHVMIYDAIPCHVMRRDVIRYMSQRHNLANSPIPCAPILISERLTMQRHDMSCHVMLCHVMSCHAIWHHAMPHHTLAWHDMLWRVVLCCSLRVSPFRVASGWWCVCISYPGLFPCAAATPYCRRYTQTYYNVWCCHVTSWKLCMVCVS